jgi:hypothetical protein
MVEKGRGSELDWSRIVPRIFPLFCCAKVSVEKIRKDRNGRMNRCFGENSMIGLGYWANPELIPDHSRKCRMKPALEHAYFDRWQKRNVSRERRFLLRVRE